MTKCQLSRIARTKFWRDRTNKQVCIKKVIIKGSNNKWQLSVWSRLKALRTKAITWTRRVALKIQLDSIVIIHRIIPKMSSFTTTYGKWVGFIRIRGFPRVVILGHTVEIQLNSTNLNWFKLRMQLTDLNNALTGLKPKPKTTDRL